MKALWLMAIACIAVAVLCVGCGKSDDMKKLEADLNTEVMQKHDDMMKAMSGLDEATAQIAAMVAKHDSLAKLLPKKFAGHDATDLLAAKEKIAAAKEAMNTWMKGFKPYDPNAEHEVVMASLKKTQEELVGVEQQVQGALTAAKESMASHSTFVNALTAKLPKKMK